MLATRTRSFDETDRRAIRLTVCLVAAAAIASMAWIYAAGLPAGGPIRSDGLGYYLYLPALVLDHDVTMERTAVRSFGGHIPEGYGVRPVPPDGRLLDKYPVGEALMVAPFFAAGHLLAVVSGATANGFSRPYEATAAAAGLTYALLGLLVLGAFLARWFSRSTVVLTLLATTFGTNLFHYATYDAVFSHAFSFFLVACALQLAVVVRDRPTSGSAVAFGLVVGLIAAVRPTNAVVLVFAALIGVVTRADAFERVNALRQHARLVAASTVGFALPLVPQIVYWREITGRWLVYSYGDEHLDLWHPHVIQVLFSVRKGLFFWTPVLLLAVFGLVFLRRRAPGLFIPAVIFLVIDTWVISSWETWWYGGSFGQRPFVEAAPVFAIGLAALLDSMKKGVARRATLVAVLVLTAVAVHSMIDYWLGIVPFDGTTWHEYVDSLTRL